MHITQYKIRILGKTSSARKRPRPTRIKTSLLRLTLFVSMLGPIYSDSIDKAELDTFFMPIINLDPLVVKSEEFSVSVFARSNPEKNYVERFAHSVVEVAYETIEKSTGHGLVIAGGKKAPHPISIFNSFLDLDQNGLLNPDLADSANELRAILDNWESLANEDEEEIESGEEDFHIDFESIATALPMPLEGVATQLYLVAWFEGFESERIDERLKNLHRSDLEQYELSKYDWIFYLPPKNSINKVIHTLLPAFMKEAELGFFKRIAIRSAIATFKPMIKDAAESIRKGILYYTVLNAMGTIEKDDLSALCEAYIEAIMPHGKIFPGDKKQRALEAIEKQKVENSEYAKDPFVAPARLSAVEVASFSKFQGEYGYDQKASRSFSINENCFYWQKWTREPQPVFPASDSLFVSDNGKWTIEFICDDEGKVTSVEERWARNRETMPRLLPD